MKMNLNRIHVVYQPGPESELADIYSGFTSIEGLFNQFRGGLEPNRIHAIFTTKEEAEQEAQRLYETNRPPTMENTIDQPDAAAIKSWFYQAKDKIELLQEVVTQDAALKQDKDLKKRLDAAAEHLDEFIFHFSTNHE